MDKIVLFAEKHARVIEAFFDKHIGTIDVCVRKTHTMRPQILHSKRITLFRLQSNFSTE